MLATLLKKRLWHRRFSCEFCDIFKNTFTISKVMTHVKWYKNTGYLYNHLILLNNIIINMSLCNALEYGNTEQGRNWVKAGQLRF